MMNDSQLVNVNFQIKCNRQRDVTSVYIMPFDTSSLFVIFVKRNLATRYFFASNEETLRNTFVAFTAQIEA